MENHQLAGKWARHFAGYSIINSRIGVNPFFGRYSLTDMTSPEASKALATGQCPA